MDETALDCDCADVVEAFLGCIPVLAADVDEGTCNTAAFINPVAFNAVVLGTDNVGVVVVGNVAVVVVL